jgi:transposase
MERATREVWGERVQRWVDSGLTAKEYAAETGLNVNSLGHWKWKLSREGGLEAEKQSHPARRGFIEVKLAGDEPAPVAPANVVKVDPFEVVLPSGLTVRVPVRFNAVALRELVQALESC